MDDINLEDTEKLLKLYARGYTFYPAIFHPELLRSVLPMIKVEGWEEEETI